METKREKIERKIEEYKIRVLKNTSLDKNDEEYVNRILSECKIQYKMKSCIYTIFKQGGYSTTYTNVFSFGKAFKETIEADEELGFEMLVCMCILFRETVKGFENMNEDEKNSIKDKLKFKMLYNFRGKSLETINNMGITKEFWKDTLIPACHAEDELLQWVSSYHHHHSVYDWDELYEKLKGIFEKINPDFKINMNYIPDAKLWIPRYSVTISLAD